MLYFIRHGETDWNRDKRFQSVSDVPLNARGLAQAEAMRDALLARGVQPALALTSPLVRARDTAKVICAPLGVAPRIEPRLTELSFGEWEGRLESELAAQFGAQFASWRASHYTLRPPGGESLADALPRLLPVVEELVGQAALPVLGEGPAPSLDKTAEGLPEAATQQDIIIIAHQAIMMALKCALTGEQSVAAAYSYKQDNDELDIWELAMPRRIVRVRV